MILAPEKGKGVDKFGSYLTNPYAATNMPMAVNE
jgi:hypothetical protein